MLLIKGKSDFVLELLISVLGQKVSEDSLGLEASCLNFPARVLGNFNSREEVD